mmetsp:Transcript_56191/g.119496  ORF Transcript_56191/g.119496 Transcript_56191/m.119496 type:complete len:96 (-) Transcript_56191:28-315(-)
MKVNFDRWRILHLLLLMVISSILAEALIAKLEWTSLSAYGFAITITTQISNAFNPDSVDADDAADDMRQKKRERILEKRRERRKGDMGAAGKKKK